MPKNSRWFRTASMRLRSGASSYVYGVVTVIVSLVCNGAVGGDLELSSVQGAGHVSLTVAQAGNKKGPQILFVHGYSQSYESWAKQLNDPGLRSKFQLIAFDLRGQGTSEKPPQAEAYSSESWAGDIAAIIAATGNRNPVLVAWSMGGPVVLSYIKHNGTANISGINLVASPALFSEVTRFPPTDPRGPRQQMISLQMRSDNVLTNIEGTRAFARMLTAKPLLPVDADVILSYGMMTPPYVRRILFETYSEWSHFGADTIRRIGVPVLITQGMADDLLPYQNSIKTREAIPRAKLSMYAGVGHAPFIEQPRRFNRELSAFTLAVTASVNSPSND